MQLSQIDLNLLRVFQQLLQDRRVSLAASSLGMSQPAVSHALRRLREALGDELFLRTSSGMEPTPYAQQLAEPVSMALETLREALTVRASFDPQQSQRHFTLAMSDVGEIYFLPVLMERLGREAPSVTVSAVSVTEPTLKDDMVAGRIDLAMGLLPQLQAGFFQQALFRQDYVLLMRGDHPLARQPQLDAEDFARAEHVRVLAGGTGHGQVDETLERQGWRPRVRLTVPHYVALSHVLASTDLVATVPQRFAERTLAPFGLAMRPLPLELPTAVIHQIWHARLHRDPGGQWLRGLLSRTFGSAPPA
jgi:DNA-binding transcriptional LysR family regulator